MDSSKCIFAASSVFCAVSLLFSIPYMLKASGDITHNMRELHDSLEMSARAMDMSADALTINDELFQRNIQSAELTGKTISAMRLTTKLTRDAISVQEEGLELLKETVSIARSTYKELKKLDSYTSRLYGLGLEAAKAGDVLYEFAKYTNQLAKESYALAQDSLSIVMGEKEPPPPEKKPKKKKKKG